MGFESIVKLEGIRTTLCFIIITIFASTGMLMGLIASVEYLGFMKVLFGIYAGAKLGFKGTDVMKAKNASTG